MALRPRNYSRGKMVLIWIAAGLTLPLWAFFGLLAILVKRLPTPVLRLLLRHHNQRTKRPVDVRIPSDEAVQPYMLRWWLIPRNGFFNIYYHVVKRSDDDRALHDHVSWSFSIILEGGYFEHMILPGGVHERKWYGPGAVRFRRNGKIARRLELNWQPTFDAGSQRGDGEEIPVKTIFITGPVLRRWGFHHEKQWVDAYEFDGFMAEHGIAGMKMEGYAEQLKGPNND